MALLNSNDVPCTIVYDRRGRPTPLLMTLLHEAARSAVYGRDEHDTFRLHIEPNNRRINTRPGVRFCSVNDWTEEHYTRWLGRSDFVWSRDLEPNRNVSRPRQLHHRRRGKPRRGRAKKMDRFLPLNETSRNAR